MLQRSISIPDLDDVAVEQEFFASIPAHAAVFALEGEGEPYVAKTADLRRRVQRMLGRPEENSKKLNLRGRVQSIAFTETGSDFESAFLLYSVLRERSPDRYAKKIKLSFAALICMHWDDPWPRALVTRRIRSSRESDVYYGPFRSRAAAEKYLNDSLDLFKTRRCTMAITPDPAYPGCPYSEMKMCLAPCFAGCTEKEYVAETERVQSYFDTAGASLRNELTAIRDKASEDLDFEQAAAMHTRLEKVQAASRERDEIVRRIDRLDGVMIKCAAEKDSVALFRISGAMISAPYVFHVEKQAAFAEGASAEAKAKPVSLESRLQQALDTISPRKPENALEQMEHLAILKRWHYRSSKLGELFLTDEKGDLPWRRIVRGVGRVLKGERLTGAEEGAIKQYWIERGNKANQQ